YGADSILYTSFWMGMATMQFFAGRDYLLRPDNLYGMMILILFSGLTMLNTYGSRFVAAAVPLIVASALYLPPESRNVVLPVFLLFEIVQFLYWFGIYIV